MGSWSRGMPISPDGGGTDSLVLNSVGMAMVTGVVPGVRMSGGLGVAVMVGEGTVVIVEVGAGVGRGGVAVGDAARTVTSSCAWTVLAAIVSIMLGSNVGLEG